MEREWEVFYPNGLIKYIDLFREKYFQYDIFDRIVDQYIQNHTKITGKKIVSLGSGTGRHEVELSKLGYEVIGLERNEESVNIANKYVNKKGANVKIIKCDFLMESEVDAVMELIGEVDHVVLLFVPISSNAYNSALKYMAKWIRTGGIFVADNFMYEKDYTYNGINIESNVEVAETKDGYAVRLNYYEYKGSLVVWDAIYLYHNDNNELVMKKDKDILEIIPEEVSDRKIHCGGFARIENRIITECEKYIAPPHLMEYLIGRIKYE